MDLWTQIDSAPVPGSDAELTLLQRNDDFAIRISDVQGDLMNSRMYHSEEVLAELGCTRLGTIENARVHQGDVVAYLKHPKKKFDAILLDVDNGPEAMTASANGWLYTRGGLKTIYEKLRPEGIVAIWSVRSDHLFTGRLKKTGFKVQTHTVRARPGKGSRHTVFVAQKPR